MEYHVPSSSIIMISVCMALGIIVPLVLFFFLNRKKHASQRAFFVGWLAFLIAVNILERLFHALVFRSSVGAYIQENLYLYALYAGIAAGLFEELARYFCFSRILKRERSHDWNALMYGAGHGGSEMFNIFSVTMANNLIYAASINSGSAGEVLGTLSGDMLVQMQAVFAQLTSTPAPMYLLSFAERIFALAAQMALSVLVFYAVKDPARNRRLLLIAVELHALIDFLAVITGGLLSPVLAEAVIFCAAAVTVFFARNVWKQNHTEKTA